MVTISLHATLTLDPHVLAVKHGSHSATAITTELLAITRVSDCQIVVDLVLQTMNLVVRDGLPADPINLVRLADRHMRTELVVPLRLWQVC